MSTSSELDEWGAALEAATGIRTTRDPALVTPPCILLEAPPATSGNLTGLHLEVPVVLLGPGDAKQATDWCLDHLKAVLDATGQTQADPGAYTLGGDTYIAYRITVPIRTEE